MNFSSQLKSFGILALSIFQFLLMSCNHNDEPALDNSSDIELRVSRYRTPGEAVKIAENAWAHLFGDSAVLSRSYNSTIVDMSRPVEVICTPSSRSTNSVDTLIYIVNYVDDGGFAVISAPKNVEELLAITESGSYDSLNTNDISRDGFDIWLEDVKSYVKEAASGAQKSTIITGPITCDTTPKLQVKEWNDTIVNSRIMPMLPGCWGQGEEDIKDMEEAPEGYYFSNGLAGCGIITLAQVGSWNKKPHYMPNIRGGSPVFPLDWSQIEDHKKVTIYSYEQNRNDVISPECLEPNQEDANKTISNLCRYIGDLCDADSYEGGTSASAKNILSTAKELFGSNSVSDSWMEYSCSKILNRSKMFIIIGSNPTTQVGHCWVCDGDIYIVYDHYYSTLADGAILWEDHYLGSQSVHYAHYNWGWYGYYNGWYAVFPRPGKYEVNYSSNMHYIVITK